MNDGLEGLEQPQRVAVIDADTLVFATLEVNKYPDNEGEYTADLDLVLDICESKITNILTATECNIAYLVFTGRGNFRNKLYPAYKAQRKSKSRPPHISETQNILLQKYHGTISRGCEADDIVCYVKNKKPEWVLASPDKDVLYAISGEHYNYFSSARFEIEPKWVEVSVLEALKHPYYQALMGDNTDNIKGAKGVGAVGANKLLKDCTTRGEMYKALIKGFKGNKEEALLNYNLVDMLMLTTVEGVLGIKLNTLRSIGGELR